MSDVEEQAQKFFQEKYGVILGKRVYENLVEATEPFKHDGDVILGTHTLELDINSDTGVVLVSKVLNTP